MDDKTVNVYVTLEKAEIVQLYRWFLFLNRSNTDLFFLLFWICSFPDYTANCKSFIRCFFFRFQHRKTKKKFNFAAVNEQTVSLYVFCSLIYMTVLIECLFKLFDMCRTCEHLKMRTWKIVFERWIMFRMTYICKYSLWADFCWKCWTTPTTTTNQPPPPPIAKQSSHLLESTLVAFLLCRIWGYAQYLDGFEWNENDQL